MRKFRRIVLADAAMFLNRHCCFPTDMPGKLDYNRMAITPEATRRAIEAWLAR